MSYLLESMNTKKIKLIIVTNCVVLYTILRKVDSNKYGGHWPLLFVTFRLSFLKVYERIQIGKPLKIISTMINETKAE